MTYSCKRCKSEYKQKRNLKRHLLSDTICPPTFCSASRSALLEEIGVKLETVQKYDCDRCTASFARRDGLDQHRSHCIFKNVVLPNFAKEQIDKMKKEIEEYKAQIMFLNNQHEKDKATITKLEKQKSRRITKVKNVPLDKLEFENKDEIDVLSFKNTDYSLFNKEKTIEKIEKYTFDFVNLIEEIFSNEQNMNIYMENVRETNVMVLESDMEWRHRFAKNYVETIHMKTCMALQTLIYDCEDDHLKSLISDEILKSNRNYRDVFREIRIFLNANRKKVTGTFIEKSLKI